MSTYPQWRIYRQNEVREPPREPVRAPIHYAPPPRPYDLTPNATPPSPPPEQPGLIQRAWEGTRDFIRSIPDRIRSVGDWIGDRFNSMRQFFSTKPEVNLNGVDKRLVHIACAIGIGAHTNCTCTDAQRSRNAGYGAANSEHHRGNAMDLRLSGVPGRTDKDKERFVADVATVLGYGGRREQDRVFASVHGGTGPHLHFQFGSNNIAHMNPAASTTGGQADLLAAQQRIARIVGAEGLERIMQTRAPDGLTYNGTPLANSYTGYRQPQAAPSPQLVYQNQPRPAYAQQRPPEATPDAPHPPRPLHINRIGSQA